MRLLVAASFGCLVACSTVQSRRDDPPDLVQTTAVSLNDFQGCFAEKTAKQDVQYLPRRSGGTFSAGAQGGVGPRYVAWVVDIDDLGSERRVTLHAISSLFGNNRKLIEQIQSCL